MARAGEKIATLTDLEQRLVALDKRLKGILSMVVFDNTLGEIKNFQILFDVNQFLGTGTAITFLRPFKTGTIPVIIGTSKNIDCCFKVTTGPTNTGFTGHSRKYDGLGAASNCMWFAIGEAGI